MLDQLKAASLSEASKFFIVANFGIFVGSVALCWSLGWLFQSRRIFDRWEPLRPIEIFAALGSIFFNAGISVFGWWLWNSDFITLKTGGMISGIYDCLAMLLFMDFGMYVLHRFVHLPSIFNLFHRFHHRHETTNPISLFVLHPVEIIGFGLLMIVFLALYRMSVGGLMGYLALNVLWGTLGHSGVEPFPGKFRSILGLSLLGTSTFHAEHHEHPRFNFGFYTLLWDKIFGTLDPEYDSRFLRDSDQVVAPISGTGKESGWSEDRFTRTDSKKGADHPAGSGSFTGFPGSQ
ncbi:MAG: sterol desaturase family protein [Armatimonadetes bacterium]|nr:sterol desaturase family protein [Akkermansiaceae bacterium]